MPSQPPTQIELIAKLRALSVLKDIDDGTIAKLCEGLLFKKVAAGDTIFHAGDEASVCYIVSFGSVKLVRSTPQGKSLVMAFLRMGDFLGAAIMPSPSPRFPLTAIAMEDSGLIQISREIYLERWQTDARVARAVNINIMGRMMEFQEDKVMAVSSVPKKIASFLLRTLDQQPDLYGNRLSLRLTRKDIADRVGTSVETVIRVLSQWTSEGLISTEDQQIFVRDRAKLEAMIDED